MDPLAEQGDDALPFGGVFKMILDIFLLHA
jgi:hypothetical protein